MRQMLAAARRLRADTVTLIVVIGLLLASAVAAWVIAARLDQPGFGWLLAGLAISLAALAPLIVIEPRDGRPTAFAELLSAGAALAVVVAVLVGG